MGLKDMDSTNSDLIWKNVTKGRRSRKLTRQGVNRVTEVGNFSSYTMGGDFSCSDADKFSEAICGQSTSCISEKLPLKKRNLLHSPSPQPWSPSLPHYDSSSRYAPDFSGIEILAAAASMEGDADDANKEHHIGEDLLMLGNREAFSLAAQSKLNVSEDSLRNMIENGGNIDCSVVLRGSSQSLHESAEDGIMPKVNRLHWDLNTLMDAWGGPCEDSFARSTSKDVSGDDVHMEERQKGYKDYVYPTGVTRDESSNLKMGANRLVAVLSGSTHLESPRLEVNSLESPSNSYSKTANETPDPITDKDADVRDSKKILGNDAPTETSTPVVNKDQTCMSCLTELLLSPILLMSADKLYTMSSAASTMQDTDCSRNVSQCNRPTASDSIPMRTEDVILHDLPDNLVTESAIVMQRKDVKDSYKASETSCGAVPLKECINPVTCGRLDVDNCKSNSGKVDNFYAPSECGNFLNSSSSSRDGQSGLNADSKIQYGTCVSSSAIVDGQGQVEKAGLLAKNEDDNLPNDESKKITKEEPSKSYIAAGQHDDLTSSAGETGSTIYDRHDSDVSQNNNAQIVDRNDLTRFQEGYDSPYEDGELRGPVSYSCEEKELENECIDYESDGRNENGFDVAKYMGSGIVEGGTEGSHGTERSLSMKRSPEGSGTKGGPFIHTLRRHFIKDESNDKEIAGKGISVTGSDTVVHESMEMIFEETYDGTKRRNMTDRRDTIGGKFAVMDEHAPKIVRRKLVSCAEGWSFMDAPDRKDVYPIQQCRSRHFGGSYSRPGRDVSPDNRYLGKYRPAINNKRDGANRWTDWGSRRCYTSEGRCNIRPRNITGDSGEECDGLEFHKRREHANYPSKRFPRPLMRRSSPPMDRDKCFGGRLPLTNGVSSYRSRGHHSQRESNNLVEDFEPRPDDTCLSAAGKRSFLPSSGGSAHMALPNMTSRSRFRIRSPGAWHDRGRGWNTGSRRHNSRSPDYRSEARIERMRVPPFQKHNSGHDYGNGYISPTRGRFSRRHDPQFSENHFRGRVRSPVRVSRHTRKLDEDFRSTLRTGRFSFMSDGDGRECKFEANCDDDRRRDDNSNEMIYRSVDRQIYFSGDCME